MRFGYASQNLTIGVTTGRTLRLANLGDADRVRSIAESNLVSLEAVVRWNAAHGMGAFRMSQQLIPFASHPEFPYDWEQVHAPALRRIGGLARSLGIRLSMHPGQFIQPGSLEAGVRERSLAELRYVARVLSLLGGADLVLHAGGAFGDKAKARARFTEALCGEEEILRFLAVENDERLWTVQDVREVADPLRVPVIVDTLHHRLNPGTLTLGEALDVALPTWRRVPKVHLSSQDPAKQRGAHAAAVTTEDYEDLRAALNGRDVDVMVEAKGKDLAVGPLVAIHRGEALIGVVPRPHGRPVSAAVVL